jgi:DNA-binding LacI/PurR family transcriptional regulator
VQAKQGEEFPVASAEAPGTGWQQQRATIQDVANQAGVSIATVSRVLNGAATVDATLAERVRTACTALDYQPNRAARALAGGRSAIMGLLVTDVQNPFYMEVLHGVEDVAQRNGYLVVLCNTSEDLRKERRYIEVLCAEPVAGAIVVPTHDRRSALQLFRGRGIPVVTLDRQIHDRSVDAVVIDNVGAAREAVAHLITNGYRRIGLITGPDGAMTARERLKGYHVALREAGIAADPRIERHGPYTEESGRQMAEELLQLETPLEAIFTGNNRLTMGALRALHARGLRVPEEMALAGFDDVPWVAPGSLSLTAILQPAYELGSTAAALLIQRLQHPGHFSRQEIVLAHHLRIGDSSRPHGFGAAGARAAQ